MRPTLVLLDHPVRIHEHPRAMFPRQSVRAPISTSFALLALIALIGCDPQLATVRGRASQQFNCPEALVTVEPMAGGAYRARACGSTVTYVCAGRVDAHICAVDVPASSTMTAPRSAPASTWSDASVRALLHTVTRPVGACFPDENHRLSVRVQISERGRVVHSSVIDGTADEEQRRCVGRALAAADLGGHASQPRVAVLRFGAWPAATPTVTEPATSGGEVAAPEALTDPSAYVRAQLDAQSARILACVESEALGVAASWDEAGVVVLALRGDRAAGVEEACVRAAVGPLRIEPAPGASGSMVHSVAR